MPSASRVGHPSQDCPRAARSPYLTHVQPDLTDEEHAAVAALVRKTKADSRFPFSDRIRILRAALAKLEPGVAPKPRQQSPPLPSTDGG